MIVVTGAAGQLGSAFARLLGSGATYLTRDTLDLQDASTVTNTIGALRPDVLINCAAYTAVDAAESNREIAQSINADAVGCMARATAAIGGYFVTISTDYVFDGSREGPYLESHPTNPINVYGETKLAGERAALELNPRSLVVRTSWLLSGTHPNFVATMLRLTRERRVDVVDDQVGRLTLVDDLARGIMRAIDADATGLLHLTNEGAVTWYELARKAVAMAGIDPDRVSPCATSDYPTPARRPRNSVLASERLSALGLDPLPSHQQGLQRVVESLVRNQMA